MEPIYNELKLERLISKSIVQAFIEGDIPMPAGREAERILGVESHIRNDAARCSHGSVQAEGTLMLNILCLDAQEQTFDVHASTRYNHSIPLENVQEGMDAEITPQLYDLRTDLRDRRVHVEAVAELNTLVRDDEPIETLTDVVGAGELYKRYNETDLSKSRELGSTSLRVHETLSAPGAAHVLRANISPHISEVKLAENGLDISGTLYVSVLYENGEAALIQLNERLPFEQFMQVELDATCGDISIRPELKDYSVGISAAEGMLDLDANLELFAACITKEQLKTLEDFYSLDGSVNCLQQEIELLMPIMNVSELCPIIENLKIPEQLPQSGRVVYTSFRPVVLNLFDDNGKLALNALLITEVVYATAEGALFKFSEDMPVKCTLDVPFSSEAIVALNPLEVRANGTGRMLNVEYLLEVLARTFIMEQLTLAAGAEETEAKPRESGIMVALAPEGDTVWNIAKRFRVTPEQLLSWNEGLVEPIREGTEILVLSRPGKKRRPS